MSPLQVEHVRNEETAMVTVKWVVQHLIWEGRQEAAVPNGGLTMDMLAAVVTAVMALVQMMDWQAG